MEKDLSDFRDILNFIECYFYTKYRSKLKRTKKMYISLTTCEIIPEPKVGFIGDDFQSCEEGIIIIDCSKHGYNIRLRQRNLGNEHIFNYSKSHKVFTHKGTKLTPEQAYEFICLRFCEYAVDPASTFATVMNQWIISTI